jgi:trehalose 6-phosphate synthase/phosphatase
LLRARLPHAKIGFFLHIPFPSSEIFKILPWRAQILEGLLGADVIGFHTHTYARHFQSSLLRILGIDSYAQHLNYAGRTIKVGAFPLGIDVNQITTNLASATCELATALTRMKNEGNVQTIMLSIDRLDYTKGLPRRLLAFEKLLDDNPDLIGSVALVQIAAPSRDQVTAYETYRSQVEGLVGRINGRFGLPGYQPIYYVSRGYSQEEILALYPLADVMVVTPLRDGMNLVAKEFIATRQDLEGVLVLSEFAGAADELGEAIQVNPYDINDTALGMLTAIKMPAEERKARMSALRSRITSFDASIWARKFIDFLQDSAKGESEISTFTKPQELLSKVPPASKRILFLDYDGTLFPIVRIPQLAKPDQPLMMLLERLASRPDLEIHIVSGRPYQVLEQWLGALPIALHAEHGAMSRLVGEKEWASAVSHGSANGWQKFVRTILEDYTKNTPGSFIEEKTHSLAWHYRMSDLVHGERMANELRLHGRETFTPMGLELLPGKRMVEVRQMGINKGEIINRVREKDGNQSAVIAIGDDITDEDMFQALPSEAMTIVVGDHPSKAKYRMRDSVDVRRFLELLTST